MNFLKHKTNLVFLFLLIVIIVFFLWAKLFWVSVGLLIIADVLSTQIIPDFLKRKLNKIGYTILKYLGFLTLPISFAILIRTFFFDVYFVPSSSMERTLLPNDYVLVNKFMYGARIPKYANDIPVIGRLFKQNLSNDHNLYRSLEAFKTYSREDIVVFKSTDNHSKFLVKRIIGLPGDTLQIKNTDVIINGTILPQRDDYCYNYIENHEGSFNTFQNLSNSEYNTLNTEEKSKLNIQIEDSTSNKYFIFPFSKQNEWTRDNYGKIVIPKKGQKITISLANYDLYKTIIKNYEQATFQLEKGEQKTYTFKNNYFFMLGDNRHNSIDSRSYGFVPENYIQGKMIAKF